MSCLVSCCVSASCGLCSSVASGISRRSARLAYCGLFGLSLITSWILREVATPLLEKIPWHPDPLGISFANDGSVNFALFSRNAESVVLCLYDGVADKPSLEIDLDSYINRAGDIWHVLMETVEPFVSYGYRVREKEKDLSQAMSFWTHMLRFLVIPSLTLLDLVLFPSALGCLSREPTFDWNGDVCPGVPMEKLMVYRLNVEHFTEAKSSQLPTEVAGTFSGLIEKLHHLKSLGISAVLLEPIFPFDVQRGPYFPSHFFSPRNFNGSTPGDNSSAINALKEMVKNLHANRIEVLLEVVFTHTCQTMTLHGIDNLSYYLFGKDVELEATTALNCNNPVIQRMVLDILQHWVTEFHIDGFCFINAALLLRGSEGEYLSRPSLVEAIAFNPLLSKTEIIADCWDPYDMAPKEVTFPHWKKWAELNTKFCHNVRKFFRGEGLLSDLATRLCGSEDMFLDGGGPTFSFNYFARNFGLPLVNLVSFCSSELSSEISWNCGEEGPTKKKVVLERRLKQIRNYLFILYISLGVPVLNMGDECGQSSGGSVSYSGRKSFDWDALETGFGVQITQFISFLSAFRVRRSDLLQRRSFIQVENISWHGSGGAQPVWEDPSSKFLGMSLKADVDEDGESSFDVSHKWGDLYVACNVNKNPETVILPSLSEGMTWFLLIDMALPFLGFFSSDGDPVIKNIARLVAYQMKSHSWISSSTHHPSKEWYQTNAVLRVSLGNFMFFGILSLIMIGVKDQNDKRDSWHHGCWILKIVLWALFIILMFFLPNVIVTIYETISKFGSGLFLLVQVIILLDFTYSWNDAWVEKDNQKWYIALLAVSIVCYIAAFVISGVLFIWFNPSGQECSLNIFFLVMTMILAFGFGIIALHPKVRNKIKI
ncbi:hypothetical protein GIB67_042162 [Kingdonia uniflora]|uniref:Glycosyl hydrolase family 13 catalytic domain-containing protein n=1 Tax=Kingdonia uniflora TaxID=39325 RepID=A0A7J7NWR4_9MAGN|nr:hypothetical protein GIB67_042162 [Kingdonia uniflora]